MDDNEKLNKLSIDMAVVKEKLISIDQKLDDRTASQKLMCRERAEILEKHDERIRSLEDDRNKGKGMLIVLSALTGGAVGIGFTILSKLFSGAI